MTDTPSVKTLLEIHYAIAPGAHWRFRWVMSRATYDALVATVGAAENVVMVVGPDHANLVGMKIRIDDTAAGLYLEWVEPENHSIPAEVVTP